MKEGLKRLLVILAVALLSLALYSCKEKQESSVTDKNASTQQTTSEKKPRCSKRCRGQFKYPGTAAFYG